jgi:hypothetical protein
MNYLERLSICLHLHCPNTANERFFLTHRIGNLFRLGGRKIFGSKQGKKAEDKSSTQLVSMDGRSRFRTEKSFTLPTFRRQNANVYGLFRGEAAAEWVNYWAGGCLRRYVSLIPMNPSLPSFLFHPKRCQQQNRMQGATPERAN